MKIEGLIRYDIPEAVVDLWRRTESGELLPLQEAAVKRKDLFGGGNLLIQAPTSSGKTFVGEMAAIHTALRQKQVVYLVPLKALAEEKYRSFSEKYSAYGLKVIISTRDHRDFDGDLERGDFSIAVVVYEKLSQLLVRRPERGVEIDLVIADELEILSDSERGAGVELLLTRLLQGRCRLIGLSAVIGGAEKLAQWMGADLLQSDQRPVELRYGVLHEGRFRYRTYNRPGEGVEELVDACSESAEEALLLNVETFARRGESSIVFVRAKHDSRRGADRIAAQVDLPPAVKAVAALELLEPTRSRDGLIAVLEHGVAFHNSDLSPDERHVVEEAFRNGEALIMVSTSTLAVGLNLPARNVFVTTEKWCYDERLGMPWKTPVLHMEYENMGGRAGRFGAGHEFGRSILVASSPFEQEACWRKYVEGEREVIDPQLARSPLEDHVLRLVASRHCRSVCELVGLLERTLSGRWVWAETCPLEEVAGRVRAALHRCVEAGMVADLSADDDALLQATPLGLAVASKGISLATAREIHAWIAASSSRSWCEADVLLALASTPDGRQAQVMLTTREYDEADYSAKLKALTWDEPSDADVPLNRIRASRLQPFFEEVRAIKVTLFLMDWLAEAPVCTIEERYNTMAGQILAAAAQLSWLLDATDAMTMALGLEMGSTSRLGILARRVALGLSPGRADLAVATGLSRSECLNLADAGLDEADAVLETSDAVLQRLVPREHVAALRAWAAANRTAGTAPVFSELLAGDGPILVVDERRPNEVRLEGRAIPLQKKQFQLLRLLAESPGDCVPYETIYTELWGETIVEQNQIHYQKRTLLQRVREHCPDWEDRLIETRNKCGFVLALEPEAVRHVRREAAVGV
ncbi:MAG: DEAD/DEAH box helicase [Candidatus Hydrogenedentes bacterium]|nr:DEAD/DEAH box helicase [Candidatus Hydrogenedentota bacterium]